MTEYEYENESEDDFHSLQSKCIEIEAILQGRILGAFGASAPRVTKGVHKKKERKENEKEGKERKR